MPDRAATRRDVRPGRGGQLGNPHARGRYRYRRSGNEEIAAIIGPKKAETVGRVTHLLEQRLSGYGILVKQFTINEVRAPASVMEAINQKNVMQQQALTAQNELR